MSWERQGIAIHVTIEGLVGEKQCHREFIEGLARTFLSDEVDVAMTENRLEWIDYKQTWSGEATLVLLCKSNGDPLTTYMKEHG